MGRSTAALVWEGHDLREMGKPLGMELILTGLLGLVAEGECREKIRLECQSQAAPPLKNAVLEELI